MIQEAKSFSITKVHLLITDKGFLLSNFGQFEHAMAHYDQAMSIDPGYDKVYKNKGKHIIILAGDLYFRAGYLNQAYDCYN